ncbi:MAG: hypothetical protein WAN48_08460 [Actinomycetes bacterium]
MGPTPARRSFARARASRRWAGALAIGAMLLGLVTAQPANAQSAPLAAVVSDDPVNTTPQVLDGTVLAIAQVGGTVVVGGQFTKERSSGSTKNVAQANLFAYDSSTGRLIQTFDPKLDGTVETVVAAPEPGQVIVGGSFRTVDGVARRGLVKLNLANGSVVSSFSASTNNTVHKILVRGDRLIVGGRFTSIGGVTRHRLAVVSATSGAVDTAFNLPVEGSRKPDVQPLPLVFEMDATSDGHYLVVLGNFLSVGGWSRNQVAVIDLRTNSVTPWQSRRTLSSCGSSVSFFFTDVEIAPTNDWFALSARGGYASPSSGELCDTVSRWPLSPTSTNAHPTWVAYTGGDTLWSVAVTPSAVYVAGHERWLDNPDCNNCAGPTSVPRPGIGAVGPVTGRALAWNPTRSRGVGAQELVATTRGLYVGSDTEKLGGEYHARLGLLPAS